MVNFWRIIQSNASAFGAGPVRARAALLLSAAGARGGEPQIPSQPIRWPAAGRAENALAGMRAHAVAALGRSWWGPAASCCAIVSARRARFLRQPTGSGRQDNDGRTRGRTRARTPTQRPRAKAVAGPKLARARPIAGPHRQPTRSPVASEISHPDSRKTRAAPTRHRSAPTRAPPRGLADRRDSSIWARGARAQVKFPVQGPDWCCWALPANQAISQLDRARSNLQPAPDDDKGAPRLPRWMTGAGAGAGAGAGGARCKWFAAGACWRANHCDRRIADDANDARRPLPSSTRWMNGLPADWLFSRIKLAPR